MSHTATCEPDGHHDDELVTVTVTGAGIVAGDRRPIPTSTPGLGALSEVRWAAAALGFFAAAVAVRVLAGAGAADIVFAACYACGGWEPALAGLRALRARSLDVDLLMVVAAVVAACIGQVLDGALLIVIFSTSGALEAVSTRRTREAVRSLLDLAPEQATRLRADGVEERVPTGELEVGDVVVVRPGERIGADGRVVEGASDVDQASITGEPLPVSRTAGDEVFAGTVNGAGALQVEVIRPAARSIVARIVAMVEEASETKARTQLWIDRVEQRYSVGMVTVTVALFVVPLLVGAALRPTLLRAMTFMIVASPCAVVLATMPPLLAAIANAGRHGVLVKSAVVIEQLGATTQVAFDKTGTLTTGAPRLGGAITTSADLTDDGILALAAAAEQLSEHPLARAVVAAAHERRLQLPVASSFRAHPGEGVEAVVDGHHVRVGRPAVLATLPDGAIGSASGLVERFEAAGRTVVVAIVDGAAVGVLWLTDELRPDAHAAVARLAQLTAAAPVLLTGDNPRAAAGIAAEVGIADVRASLLPEDKATAVRDLQQMAGRLVTLVGDGVNDAPALATANLGVAMGRHGSDLALETADMVIVRDELAALPAALVLARRARRVVTVNLIFAGLVIALLVAVDLSGHLPLPLGVAAHEGSTVVVGLNGLRLLRRRHWVTA